MKVIETKVYSFNELSKEAKQTAIEYFRSNSNDCQIYFDDIIDSIKKMIDVFNLKTGRDYSDIRCSHLDDNILQLSGVRLYKYIMNNYYNDLFAPEYIKTIDKEFRCRLFICKTYDSKRTGGKYTQVYSRTKKTNSCVLTGVCYDDDILAPVYDFLKKPCRSTTFEELIMEIENAINKTFRDTEEWMYSEEYITDMIESNEYDFTENGKLF